MESRRGFRILFVSLLLLAPLVVAACSPSTEPAAQPATLLAAGDIADCESIGDDLTAALLDTIPGIVATLGDNVYPNGTMANYKNCFAPSWGRHLDRIRPVPGNHDFEVNADAYYTYFGAAAGTPGLGYYSYDAGPWHVIALNSEQDYAQRETQLSWLVEDLERSGKECTLAYWHEPLFSSSLHGTDPDRRAEFWNVLYRGNAEIVLNGHDHIYERFAPQTPAGVADPDKGMREFVVGTGGRSHYPRLSTLANSEFFDTNDFGVLRLRLKAGGYHWDFIAITGAIIDSGDGNCH